MVDAGIRPKRHNDIGSDIPIFAGALILVGGVVGAVVAFTVDRVLHRKR